MKDARLSTDCGDVAIQDWALAAPGLAPHQSPVGGENSDDGQARDQPDLDQCRAPFILLKSGEEGQRRSLRGDNLQLDIGIVSFRDHFFDG